MAAAALSLNGSVVRGNSSPARAVSARRDGLRRWRIPMWAPGALLCRKSPSRRAQPLAGSRADDSSAPQEMTVESALKILGVAEGASFDEIVRAKNAVLASSRDDTEAVAQVEAAYEVLLMQSLSRRRSGKVANSGIRYADVRPRKSTGLNALPEWLQARIKNIPVSIESPSAIDLGTKGGVYGALMLFTFVSGSSPTSAGPYTGADVPGLIIATSIGASLYFLSKKRLGLGKAAVVSVGGLVVGAAIGSAVEQWLQVDIVSFYGIHSPAIIVSEFILISQFLVSLYLT
ncbi:protein CHAPERONE-LIKE PROTEIN OF POR1, chloroplastic [Curcuma longa]|uniref:protein CHAPERONE-LIKE PROTEIN OF POR1, chloroplastic n=1 Tax=Curcuma longa TaxID=136217 RepID=UPI003D9EC980